MMHTLMAALAVSDSCTGFRPQCQKKRFPITTEACSRDQKQQLIHAAKPGFCKEMKAGKHLGQNKQSCRVTPFNQIGLVLFLFSNRDFCCENLHEHTDSRVATGEVF